jgi:hypothetical protein
MSNITKNHKVGIFAIFIASALMLGTISVSGLDSAFATKDKSHYNKGSGSEVEQEIEMNQAIKQHSSCKTGFISLVDCNHVGLNLQLNTGDQTAGQE